MTLESRVFLYDNTGSDEAISLLHVSNIWLVTVQGDLYKVEPEFKSTTTFEFKGSVFALVTSTLNDQWVSSLYIWPFVIVNSAIKVIGSGASFPLCQVIVDVGVRPVLWNIFNKSPSTWLLYSQVHKNLTPLLSLYPVCNKHLAIADSVVPDALRTDKSTFIMPISL